MISSQNVYLNVIRCYYQNTHRNVDVDSLKCMLIRMVHYDVHTTVHITVHTDVEENVHKDVHADVQIGVHKDVH